MDDKNTNNNNNTLVVLLFIIPIVLSVIGGIGCLSVMKDAGSIVNSFMYSLISTVLLYISLIITACVEKKYLTVIFGSIAGGAFIMVVFFGIKFLKQCFSMGPGYMTCYLLGKALFLIMLVISVIRSGNDVKTDTPS